MARSRKDSTGANAVDNYRKQIAKQDTKKSKESLKNIKFLSDKKENAPTVYKDVSIMVGALLVLCLCVYCIFYALLSTQ
ncbi:triple QxxK/R motif-containing protein-like [Periplaneta americana]|uniref:triple QxxK/R motif-containing protein-like n=1 Tax=Periplaneta americana TaxID=6978 RepID=UPI0037E8B1FF